MEVFKTSTQIRYIAWKTISFVYIYFFPNVEQDVSEADKIEAQKRFRDMKKDFVIKCKPGYDRIPDEELEVS